ncbi:MAG: sulfite exporter TauE/SafE family protein [Chitinophagaceae bacterium]|nr:sulfite exporter TauE/SafE family protein [Chitinophagaceae bacterium]
MDVFLICAAALLGSALTFFSGFGLGTLLLPVFGLFFPIEVAIAMTAVVHFLNNIFKLSLTYKNIEKKIAWQFGLPAMLAAIAGAWLLSQLPTYTLHTYSIATNTYYITLLKTLIGILMLLFALFEILPSLKRSTVSPTWLPLGGLLSGFFGGLSGHQGALRSVFLLRLQLSKQTFIATGIAIACMIDISRLSMYAQQLSKVNTLPWAQVAAATVAAFAGAWMGNIWLKKITMPAFQWMVAIFIILFACLLILGIV